MTGLTALLLIASASSPDLPASLKVGKDFYLPGPVVRLGSFITFEKFSRDSKFLVYVDERTESNYSKNKERIQNGEDAPPTLVRYDIQRGSKETLYVPEANETLMNVEPVGRSGDVICSIAIGTSQDDKVLWKAIFFPQGGSPRVLANGIRSRSFQISASPTERKAFVLICSLDTPSKYLFVTPEKTLIAELPSSAFQVGFFLQTRDGNPIVGLQGPAPDYKTLGNYELSFSTGGFRLLTDLPENRPDNSSSELLSFDTIERSKGDSTIGEGPLLEIVARPKDPKLGLGRLIVEQGVIAILQPSPDGLTVVYLAPSGIYIRELVKASPSLADRIRATRQA